MAAEPSSHGASFLAKLNKADGGIPMLGGVYLRDLLGEGGFGLVFRGWHSRLDIPVAVKVLRTSAPEVNRRLMSEARLAAKVNHPNVVRVYDLNRDQGYIYIVQELVEGVTAADILVETRLAGGPLIEERGLEIGQDVARGLAAIHQAGILHLDIKPTNIIVRKRDGLAKILDLGLARFLQRGARALHVLQSAGTVGYSSPEQLQLNPCTPASDIYSLGVVLYELLTNQMAFPQENSQLVVQAQAATAALDPREKNPAVSAPTAQVVVRCTACEARDRFGDALALLTALGSARAALEPTASPAAAAPSAPGAPQAGTVVHVDDDPQQQELVKEMLGREGYAVAGFASGEEALSFLCMNCADVLLLDLILAEEDGLAVCRKVRAMPNCQDLPIVFLSGIGQDQIVEQALALGAADYLLKPVKPADLVARVRCLARLGQVRREHAALEQEFRALSRVGPGPLPKGKQT